MYRSKLDLKETQLAIQTLKFSFTKKLNKELNLTRVSAPLFVESKTKLNDGLNGEKPISFKPKFLNKELEIIHSLAKWKRQALKKYNFNIYEGLWTDMNAIRQEEVLDELHSIYVDQWDWELMIKETDRNFNFLKTIVNKIYQAIRYVENKIVFKFPTLRVKLPKEIVFISSQELLDLYPNVEPNKREYEFAKIHKAFFVYGIGHKLSNNEPHSFRAFDYDDWNLNGDLIVYDSIFDRAIELSSMGIRVDANSLIKQADLAKTGKNDFANYHQLILNNALPFTIGGGIGQSRLSMFILEKKHIGEVQVSEWNNEVIDEEVVNYLL